MKFIKHFKTITHHRHEVIKNCFRVGIGFQGLFHDLSKYSYTEFRIGAKYYMGTKSPNDCERSIFGFSSAWMHHKGRNKHHFEYWNDYNPQTHEIDSVKMPLKYMKEMLCDRIAASKTYLGDAYDDTEPLKYYRRSRAKNYMHPENAEMLEEWLTMLAGQGEAKTFAHIKKLK